MKNQSSSGSVADRERGRASSHLGMTTEGEGGGGLHIRRSGGG